MRRVTIAILASLACGLAIIEIGKADEQIVPLAESGDWEAAAHQVSMTAPPDVCVAANMQQGLVFRADPDGVQLRMSDEKWSLPSGVHGNIVVSVGTWKVTLGITGNTATMVSADIQTDDVVQMFSAMDKAGSMTVKVGNSPPATISLAGSTRATDAFRTCAGIKGNAKTPGTNPFQ